MWRSRFHCNPKKRTPSHSAKSVEERRRDKVGTRWGEKPGGERGKAARSGAPQARHRAHPGWRAKHEIYVWSLPTCCLRSLKEMAMSEVGERRSSSWIARAGGAGASHPAWTIASWNAS